MADKTTSGEMRTKCSACPLRKRGSFRDFNGEELKFVSSFKTGELTSDQGATILVEGSHSAHLYTVLSGAAFRYKILDDGRRQILNYLMPGDIVGLQGTLMGEMQHSVEALTPLTLCVFERGRVEELFSNHPSLSFDLTWLAAREERFLDEHLLSIGRRSALERAAYLLAFLERRAADTGFVHQRAKIMPLTQQHVADTLGLSIVHTNKTLRKLADRKMLRWLDKGYEVLDPEGLSVIAGWESGSQSPRPFI
jgi:CRP-like cAMP-binding protein